MQRWDLAEMRPCAKLITLFYLAATGPGSERSGEISFRFHHVPVGQIDRFNQGVYKTTTTSFFFFFCFVKVSYIKSVISGTNMSSTFQEIICSHSNQSDGILF